MQWEVLLFGLAVTVVTLGCLLPARWVPLLPHDKLLHFIAFGGLTVLAAPLAPSWAQLRWWLLGLLVAGWAIEVLQTFVPGRSFCWRDQAANVAGMAVATAGILLLRAF